MRKIYSADRGAIMLEGIIVVTITLLVLIWILGLGFLYYQKYVVRIATNDAAKKVADTYYNPSSDIIMGYVNTTDIVNRSLYATSDLVDINRTRAESYVQYNLAKANFAGTVDEVEVSLEFVTDSVLGRSHVKLTTTCSFNTPFGAGLDFMGMNGLATYTVTSYAESTNITTYVSNVSFADTLTNGTYLSGTGFIEKAVKFVNTFIKMYNQLSS